MQRNGYNLKLKWNFSIKIENKGKVNNFRPTYCPISEMHDFS